MSYYVRWRGQITGPYTQEALLEMWAQGRVTRFHELSEDRKQWKPLLDFDAFRPLVPVVPSTRTASSVRESAPAATPRPVVLSRLRVRDDSTVPEVDEPPPVEVFWYCLPGQQVQGPLSAAALKSMANRGDIPAETMICLATDESAGGEQSIRWMPMKYLENGSFRNQPAGELSVWEDSSPHPTGPAVSSLATTSLVLGLLAIIVSLLAALGFLVNWKLKSSRVQSTIQSQSASLKPLTPDAGIAMGNFNGSNVAAIAAANQTRSNATSTDLQDNTASSLTTQREAQVKEDNGTGNREAKKEQRPENPNRQNREH